MEKEEKLYCVYKHTSPNGKVYIGMTNKQPPEKRWYSNGSGYKRQKLFWRAICKYGWDNFKHDIIFENLSKEDAAEKEQELISLYDSTDPDKGYNCSTGGECSLAGVKWTDEQRQQRSASWQGDGNPFFGKKHTEESKAKMSQSHQGQSSPNKGKIPSLETIQLWSEQRKGQNRTPKGPMKETTKEKLSEEHNFQKKPVAQFDKNNNFISEYRSISEAHRSTGVAIDKISRCCRGLIEFAGEYIWQYKNKEDGDTTAHVTSKARPVIQLTTNSQLVREYNSISEATSVTGISVSGISACCKHKRLSAGGFIWRYKEDE